MSGPTGQPPQNKSYYDMTPEEQAQVGAEHMMKFMSSCPGKMVFAGVTGFALGGVFGLFMSSMSWDYQAGASEAAKIAHLPFKQQMKIQFSDMGRRSYSSAKNFGYIGGVYSFVECCIESLRAKNDIYNSISAGCITGGGLAIKSGPQGVLFGCGAFAAFSTAIETYMRMDERPPPSTDEDE